MAFRAGPKAAALAVVLATFLATTCFAAQRVVLFEETTNWGCPPCATSNPIIQQLLGDYGSQIAAVKWHVWWPDGSDPWYNHNPVPVQNRVSYYGINAAPDVVIDGRNGPDPHSYGDMAAWVNSRLAITSPIAISGSGLIQGNDINISFDCDVEVAQVGGSNYRLYVVVTEEDIPVPHPNGEPGAHDVFRQITNMSGEPIDLSVAGVQHFDRTLPLHPSYNLLDLHAVIWVQDITAPHGTDYELLQAAEIPLLVPYHVSWEYTSGPVQIGDVNEAVNFTSEAVNDGANADVYDITVTGVPAGWAYSYTTPAGTFSGPSTLALNIGETAAISLVLDSQGLAGSGSVDIDLVSQADPLVTASLEFRKINGLDVLLVDDDDGDARENHFIPGLTGVIWDRWDMEAWGSLTQDDLTNAAGVVIWACGITGPLGAATTFTPEDRAAVDGYLAGGGKLFASGSDIGYNLADPASPDYSAASQAWFEQTLHATYLANYVIAVQTVNGTPGDPISGGLNGIVLTSQPYNRGTPDAINPGAGANPVWTFINRPENAGVRYDGGASKVVYFSFGFENLGDQATRDLVMGRILEWFGTSTGIPSPGEAPVVTSLFQNHPNPFTPETVIEYALSAEGRAQIRIYDLNGRMVRELVNDVQTPQRYRVSWDGRDESGRELNSGVYFYQLTAPGVQQTKRMVLTK